LEKKTPKIVCPHYSKLALFWSKTGTGFRGGLQWALDLALICEAAP